MGKSGLHSKDLHSYKSYLDNRDTRNETSLNSEGAGVGNYRPVAKAGEDILFSAVGKSLNLSARNSYDEDGDELSYAWSLVKKPSGSSVLIEGSDKPEALLSPDVLGDYEIELEVSDGKQTSKAQVIVSSNNVRPKARPGLDLLVDLNDTARLDGTASADKVVELRGRQRVIPKNSEKLK